MSFNPERGTRRLKSIYHKLFMVLALKSSPHQGLPENKIPNKKIEKCFFEKVIIFV
jgi:hypothetical protein